MSTISFQQGSAYTGTSDTTIRQARPNAAPGAAKSLTVDGDPGGVVQTLLAFANIFGPGPGQIPIGATIVSATVTLRTGDASTSGASLHRMLIDWNEASSWGSLVNGVQLNGVEAVAASDLDTGSVQTGVRAFTVTTSLQAWLAGATTATEANDANMGWVFSAAGTDSWGFKSSESNVAPILTVTYTMSGEEQPVTIGPSTSTAPYLVPSQPNVQFASVLTFSDPMPGGGRFAGAPDGTGAFDNGDGTITVLVNHELRAGAGLVRDHGSRGAFVDRLVIDPGTLAVVASDDLIKSVQLWDVATGSYVSTTTAFDRLCSSDLPVQTAFLIAGSGLGSTERIYLTGEEADNAGQAFATIVTGPDAGIAFELPRMGKLAYENVVANPFEQDKTIVAISDDIEGGQVYIYVGQKQSTGLEIDKAGLTNGALYGLKVSGFPDEADATPANGTFTLQEIGPGGDVSAMTGLEMEAESDLEGVTGFLRPEDICWDPDNPNVLYFTTTNTFAGNSRLYKVTFTDISDPQLGGTIEAVLTGTEGHKRLDNLTIADGKIILQEDPGDIDYLAKIWEYDIATDSLTQLAEFDPARFTPGAPGFITQDEESSGVLDVSAWFGDADTRAFLVNAMIDVPTAATVKQGQLMIMYVDDPAAAELESSPTLTRLDPVRPKHDANGALEAQGMQSPLEMFDLQFWADDYLL